MPHFASRKNFSPVIFDDAFANRQAESGSVRFSMRRKWLEKFVRHFRRDARPAVLKFHDDFVLGRLETQNNFSAVRHHIDGVVNEVVKNARQPGGINSHKNFRDRGLKFNLHRFHFSLRTDLFD